uniref:Ig-like domain-containing protein n=1 Tax=Anabas testudineus TaxID=64144 RepID=A0A3Q1J0A1_ANATE
HYPVGGALLVHCVQPFYKVIQTTGDVTATEGDAVTLNCMFETSYTGPYLFWYKQEKNNFLKYILRRDTIGTKDNAPEFNKQRFDAAIEDKSVPLKIQKLHVSDSAVYYCALRPTVTGNSKTLYKNLWSKETENSTTSTRGTHTLFNSDVILRVELTAETHSPTTLVITFKSVLMMFFLSLVFVSLE